MDHDHVIPGSRILLRPLKREDLELIRMWRNQDDIRTSFISQQKIESDQQLMWYNNYLQRTNDLMFVIEEQGQQNRPIGTVALYHIDIKERTAEFGRLMIGETGSRGRGTGIEVVNLACNFGIHILGLREIYLLVLQDNPKAVRLYEKCGFQRTGVVLKEHLTAIRMSLYGERRNELDPGR